MDMPAESVISTGREIGTGISGKLEFVWQDNNIRVIKAKEIILGCLFINRYIPFW
jgi:hypothetical protein